MHYTLAQPPTFSYSFYPLSCTYPLFEINTFLIVSKNITYVYRHQDDTVSGQNKGR